MEGYIVDFTCPHCKEKARIIEVMNDVAVSSEVNSIFSDGEVIYGEQTNSDGDIVSYVCSFCNEELFNPEETELLDYLKDNRFLKE